MRFIVVLLVSCIILVPIVLAVVLTKRKALEVRIDNPNLRNDRVSPEQPNSLGDGALDLTISNTDSKDLRWGAETCLGKSCFHLETNVVQLSHDVVSHQFCYKFQIAPNDTQDGPVVMVFETEYHEAFAHWVYESAIHLAAFQDLREKFPEAKLLLQGKRKYKKLLLDQFGWTYENDVIFELPFPNRCYFCPVFCFNDRTGMNVSVFRNLYLQLFQFLRSSAELPLQVTVPVLYLPRSHVENFVYNDRTVLSTHEIRDWCTKKGGQVLEVHTIEDIRDQISRIQAAKTIILDYGSSLFVNGLFARSGTNLIILNNMNQHLDYPAYGAVWGDIQDRCHIRFVDRLQNSVNLQFHITDVEKAYHELLLSQTA